jgi:hypothetical protein
VVSLAAPSSTSSAGLTTPMDASPSDKSQSILSRKPAVTESGDLPAPTSVGATSEPASSKTELQLGPATGDVEADAKPVLPPPSGDAPAAGSGAPAAGSGAGGEGVTAEKPGKIRVTGEE